jgi:hypothetical protein
VKAIALANRLNAIVREHGRDIEVRLMIDDTNGDCLGASALHDVWSGEDVAETQFLIVLSGTEAQP